MYSGNVLEALLGCISIRQVLRGTFSIKHHSLIKPTVIDSQLDLPYIITGPLMAQLSKAPLWLRQQLSLDQLVQQRELVLVVDDVSWLQPARPGGRLGTGHQL